jgi:3-oxoacyl-[acyl-carrier-protein] synthase-3
VFVETIGYELPPIVVTSAEARLAPVYEALHFQPGQLEALTGISERRYWSPGTPLSQSAITAAHAALDASAVVPSDIDVLIYAGVCRESFEPATACRVANGVGVSPSAAVYDISNACLGVLNGMLDIANRIELGQIRAGLVVSCESAREIVDIMIDRLIAEPDMELFKLSLATLTGGSGAAAVLLTDGSFNSSSSTSGHRLLGGVTRTAPEHYGLCTWGMEETSPATFGQLMSTDAVAVLEYGVALGLETWKAFKREMGWRGEDVEKTICHQVGSSHQEFILQTLEIPESKDFTTFAYLGNMGTVSLPITAALAAEREVLQSGNEVAFLGIGSGLNCLMLGLEW